MAKNTVTPLFGRKQPPSVERLFDRAHLLFNEVSEARLAADGATRFGLLARQEQTAFANEVENFYGSGRLERHRPNSSYRFLALRGLGMALLTYDRQPVRGEALHFYEDPTDMRIITTSFTRATPRGSTQLETLPGQRLKPGQLIALYTHLQTARRELIAPDTAGTTLAVLTFELDDPDQ